MALDGGSTGRVLFQGALLGGAAALGSNAAGFAPGAPADLMSFDADHAALAGRHGDALLDAWIFAARDAAVDCVWARGKKMVEKGRHRQRDEITRKFRAAMERLQAS
jgi:formimidoylglutamate deiminase